MPKGRMKKLLFIMHNLELDLARQSKLITNLLVMVLIGSIWSNANSEIIPSNKQCVEFGYCAMGIYALKGDTAKERYILTKKEEEAKPSKEREDSLMKIENPSFWKKLGVGIGYSGGIYHTGGDLSRYTDWDPLAWLNPLNWTYWLNSIEADVFYQLNGKRGVEIGGGYGWTIIRQSKYDNWEFKLIPIFFGYKLGKFIYRVKYIFLFVKDHGKTLGSTWKNGKGSGYNFTITYRVNKYVGLSLSVGSGKFSVKEYFPDHISEYPMKICFNGVIFSIGYNFKPMGGV